MDNLFRQKALESYKDRFAVNKYVSRVPLHIWAVGALFAVGIILSAIWLIFGKVTTSVDVEGVVFPPGGFEDISSPSYGTLRNMLIDVGDEVNVGDVIAVIPDIVMLEDIEEAKRDGTDEETILRMQKQYKDKSLVKSKTSGIVVSREAKGNYVSAGNRVALVAAVKPNDNQKQVLAFMPTSNRYSVTVGCQVQVSPNYAPREKYGYINGYVSYVGGETITNKTLDKMFDAYNIADMLKDGETYFAVYINLIYDEEEEDKLVWSLESNEDIPVELGANCMSTIVVYQESPLEWLFGGYNR